MAPPPESAKITSEHRAPNHRNGTTTQEQECCRPLSSEYGQYGDTREEYGRQWEGEAQEPGGCGPNQGRDDAKEKGTTDANSCDANKNVTDFLGEPCCHKEVVDRRSSQEQGQYEQQALQHWCV